MGKPQAGVFAHRVSLTHSLDNRFDGDSLNFSIAVDNFMSDLWEPLAPHHNVFVANSPRDISGNISIPKPTISTISHWLEAANRTPPPADKLARFNALPDA